MRRGLNKTDSPDLKGRAPNYNLEFRTRGFTARIARLTGNLDYRTGATRGIASTDIKNAD